MMIVKNITNDDKTFFCSAEDHVVASRLPFIKSAEIVDMSMEEYNDIQATEKSAYFFKYPKGKS